MDNLTMYLLSATVYTVKSEILNDLKHIFWETIIPNETRLRKLVLGNLDMFVWTKTNKRSVDESTNAKESPDFLVFHVLTFEFCVIFLLIQMTREILFNRRRKNALHTYQDHKRFIRNTNASSLIRSLYRISML